MHQDETETKRLKLVALVTGFVLAIGGATMTLPYEWTSDTFPPKFHRTSRYLKTTPKVKWSHAATDRTGHAVMDMIKAQADCFGHGWEYGGACGYTKRHSLNADVIERLGLGEVVGYDCPPDPDDEKYYLPSHHYRHDELKAFTQDWFDFMKMSAPRLVELGTKYGEDDIFRVAVHIRRGDVTLCTGNAWKRYLPNSHFVRLIERVLEDVTQPYEVTIYSEAQYGKERYVQYEDFQVFKDKNYKVVLGGDLVEVFEAFISADVLITGKSSFSILPAFLRLDRGGVIYTPFVQDEALPFWEVVDEEFMAITDAEMYEMEKMVCPQHGAETDREKFTDFED